MTERILVTGDGQPADYIARSRQRLSRYEPRTLQAPDAMPAAVLLLLSHTAGVDRLLLTVRSHIVEHHKGQISFPGGAVHDADSSLEMTALRETWEEVGVAPEDVEIVGRLDEMITNSNFLVTPFVGVLSRTPYEYVPSMAEVAEVIEPSIAHLLDRANLRWEEREVEGRVFRSPAYMFNEHRIFGATARMLSQFLSLLAENGSDGKRHSL
jgi:8-oxo-dGTP pyrophosphatase MutT (NUDIX family)